MNPEELWETTLNPDNRTMLRVQYSKGTKDKSKEDQKIIKVLMGDEVAPRKDFITNNALDVANLDIYSFMDFSTLFRTKENLSLDKNTLTILRYIAIIGQILAIKYCFLLLKFTVSNYRELFDHFIGFSHKLVSSICD